MNEFIGKHRLRPVVDRVFELDDAVEAFEFMESGSYLGKIVIRL
jgi:NADPH:quinone reductase-like Zn-dependent oxidoreductase